MISCIIQARMGSTRLPSKVLLDIKGKPMLHYVVKQITDSKFIDEIIIATSTCMKDKSIIKFCKNNKIKFFRGSRNNVLDRYYKCAKKFNCRNIVRITADCPLIDPLIVDKIIKKFLNGTYDLVTNSLIKKNNRWDLSECNFPHGMTAAVTSIEILEKIWKKSTCDFEQEHVFPYVLSHPTEFKIGNIVNKRDLSFIRCTVDKREDIEFVREIYNNIPDDRIVHLSDIIEIINSNPDLLKINKGISFDEGWKKSLNIYMEKVYD